MNDLSIVKEFLEGTRKNEIKLITPEVYNAIGNITYENSKKDELIKDLNTTLRIISGYVDNLELYKGKGYDEGFETNVNNLHLTINKALEKLL